MNEQKAQVRDFFDRISGGYRDKYKAETDFHHYFFNQRLEAATAGIDFTNATILDIGAGTGNLYDYLTARFSGINFYATDISAKMLEQSRIAPANQFVGNVYDIEFPVAKFDFIFMLGVTTYLEAEEMNKVIDFIERSLTDDGRAIITFTNRFSFDNFTRSTAKTFAKLMRFKNSVLAQSFAIHTYNLPAVNRLPDNKLQVERVAFLNQTVFPFNMLLPKASVQIARGIEKRAKAHSLLSLLSSDFVVFWRKCN